MLTYGEQDTISEERQNMAKREVDSQDTQAQTREKTPPVSWNTWVKTARPFSLTATVSPVLVGTAVAVYDGTFHLVNFLAGPAIILFGLAGMIIAYFYSAKPFKFATRGLGDILVYIAMGFLMTWGAYYVQIPHWSWQAFAASIPVGFLVTAILNMNNVRDYQDDLAVHKRTLPVRFGQVFGQRFHAFLLLGSYIAVSLFVLLELLPLYSLAVWITFPLAFNNVRAVLAATDRKAFVIGIKRTAQLHLQFGVMLALGIAAVTILRSLGV